jgi:hypothetical protein
MHDSLVPRIAWPRLKPSSASQPLPGSRLLQRQRVSRKYVQRVRCSRLPPIVAALRICPDAPLSSASDTAGNRSATVASYATSLLRASAPMRTTSQRTSIASSGRRDMSMTRPGRSTSPFIRSTSVVPPA